MLIVLLEKKKNINCTHRDS